MNYLEGSSCYLVGPIEHDDDAGCKWRKLISYHLNNLKVKIYNPLDRPEWLQKIMPYTQPNETRMQILENIDIGEDEHWRLSQTMIRKVCLRYVNTCDFVICYLNNTKTYGTTEELARANGLGKPILCVLDGAMPSLWLWDILKDHIIFESFDELAQFLSNVADGKEYVSALNWIFLGDGYERKSIAWQEV